MAQLLLWTSSTKFTDQIEANSRKKLQLCVTSFALQKKLACVIAAFFISIFYSVTFTVLNTLQEK